MTAHPEFFTTKPDGTIAYAENPPKKYQDIYPINFDNDPAGIYAEARRVLQVWIDAGVKVFRVDNPHTKAINFWHWIIWDVKKSHPDVLFLAEAFTKPAMMHQLARVGFTQSYTYFTWRTQKWEIEQYGRELAGTAHYMRPNFFVNTPDILHASLQFGGPPMFKIRAVLAAMMSPPGASTPATSSTSTSRSSRAARSTWTPRSSSCAPATTTARSRRAGRWRPT